MAPRSNPSAPLRVTMIGRLHFLVQSRSRSHVEHVVDFEDNEYEIAPACSCEQNRFRFLKCHHITAVEQFCLDYLNQKAHEPIP